VRDDHRLVIGAAAEQAIDRFQRHSNRCWPVALRGTNQRPGEGCCHVERSQDPTSTKPPTTRARAPTARSRGGPLCRNACSEAGENRQFENDLLRGAFGYIGVTWTRRERTQNAPHRRSGRTAVQRDCVQCGFGTELHRSLERTWASFSSSRINKPIAVDVAASVQF
jgi:hypothetical protein